MMNKVLDWLKRAVIGESMKKPSYITRCPECEEQVVIDGEWMPVAETDAFSARARIKVREHCKGVEEDHD